MLLLKRISVESKIRSFHLILTFLFEENFTDLANFAVVNEVMAEFIEQPFPARAAVGVASLPKGIQVEAEAVLVLNA